MNLADLSTTQIIIIIAVAAVVVLAIVGIALSIRKRRTEKLRNRFGNAEYTRAVTEGGSQSKAEAALNERAVRVERLPHPSTWRRRPHPLHRFLGQNPVPLR